MNHWIYLKEEAYSMLDVIIWGYGRQYNEILLNIRYFQLNGQIRVLGIITNQDMYMKHIDGFAVYRPQDTKSLKYDICILCQDEKTIDEVSAFAVREKIVLSRVLKVPYFDFSKYLSLMNSPVSIVSQNCFAGYAYNRLGLEFSSPTINMWFSFSDFVSFVSDVDKNLKQELVLDGYGTDKFQNDFKYPIAKIGGLDISVHLNHYNDFNEAHDSWNRRKKRINYNNIFIVASTDKESDIELFDKIPFRKVLFVPNSLDVDKDYIISLNYETNKEGRTIGMFANGFANGAFSGIDLLSFINGQTWKCYE